MRIIGVALCISGFLAAAAFPSSSALSLECVLAVGAGLILIA